MIAVTGAMIATGVAVSVAVATGPRGRDPAPAVTGTVPAVTVAGRPSLSRQAGGPGLYSARRVSRVAVVARARCARCRPLCLPLPLLHAAAGLP